MWTMWTSGLTPNVLSACFPLVLPHWTFVTGILVHIRQKKNITLEIASYMFLPTFCCPSKQSIDALRVVNWKMVNLASSPVLITEPRFDEKKTRRKTHMRLLICPQHQRQPYTCRCKDFWSNLFLFFVYCQLPVLNTVPQHLITAEEIATKR